MSGPELERRSRRLHLTAPRSTRSRGAPQQERQGRCRYNALYDCDSSAIHPHPPTVFQSHSLILRSFIMSHVGKLGPTEVAYLKDKLPDFQRQTATGKREFVAQCAKELVELRQEDVNHPYVMECLHIVSGTYFSAGWRSGNCALTR